MKKKQLIMVAILAIYSKLDYIETTVTGDTWTKLTNRITRKYQYNPRKLVVNPRNEIISYDLVASPAVELWFMT